MSHLKNVTCGWFKVDRPDSVKKNRLETDQCPLICALSAISDFEIHDGCLTINRVVFPLAKMNCTKFEVERPCSFGENI